jgi:hypothetical protein
MESGAKGCEVLCRYVISQSSSLECDDRRSQFVLLLPYRLESSNIC